MNFSQWLKNLSMKLFGIKRIANPNNERMTYINDSEAIRISSIREYKIWYTGSSNELLNWYTNQMTYGFAKNLIYNRNKMQGFWSRSVPESVARIHSGIPRAMVDTTSDIVGLPIINCDEDPVLDEILKANNFDELLSQKARTGVLVESDGCWKINISTKISKHPIIEWYGAEDWEPIKAANQLIGLVFKSYYQDKNNKDYMLTETRTITDEGVLIKYNLFTLNKDDYLIEVSLNTIPELEGLENQLLKGIKCLLAVPMKYYYNPLYPDRGKSMYEGVVDQFHLLDEILTQAGQTNRVSTPVEYYPVDLLERDSKSQPGLPSLYNRQYVKLEMTPDGDGNVNNQIITTQPSLNFEQYITLYNNIRDNIFIGRLSPSSFGINVARDDNASAQREKEKQTIFTRNTIIHCETNAITKLCNYLLIAQNYINTGSLIEKDYNITIKYDEFANPSFESELQILGPAWSRGEISTENYASLLWGGKLSDEELQKEIEWLDANRSRDDFDMGMLNENGIRKDLPAEESAEKDSDGVEE